MNKMSPKN